MHEYAVTYGQFRERNGKIYMFSFSDLLDIRLIVCLHIANSPEPYSQNDFNIHGHFLFLNITQNCWLIVCFIHGQITSIT